MTGYSPAAVLAATIGDNPFIPEAVKDGLTSPQARFLADTALESLYGGAAGGGKSVALLAGALQYAENAGYHAIILRRTFPQLSQPGALIPMSHEWGLRRKGARWDGSKHRWTFPNGGTLTFGHVQNDNDVYNYQGANYSYVAFDELTQFTEFPYRYLFSRVRRRADDDVPVRIRSASNPGGIGHEWVKARFISPMEPKPGRTFHRALLADNPHLDRAAYLKSLAELPELVRDQLENGDWDAFVGGKFDVSCIGRFNWLPLSPSQPRGKIRLPDGTQFDPWACRRFCTVDPASTADRQNDPTVISTWCDGPKGELIWLGCHRGWFDFADVVDEVVTVAEFWRPAVILIEAVAANNGIFKLAARKPGLPVGRCHPLGLDKLARATSAVYAVNGGRVFIPRDDPMFPVDDVLGELSRFTGDDKLDAHDDIVDTLSYASNRVGSTGGVAPQAAGQMADRFRAVGRRI